MEDLATSSPAYLLALVNEVLDARPFPSTSVGIEEFLSLFEHRSLYNAVECAAFLIGHGYEHLYPRILADLRNEEVGIRMPARIKTILESSSLAVVLERSNDTLTSDRERREAPSGGWGAREAELNNTFPIVFANNRHRGDCPNCVICQEELKLRQHIRIIHDKHIFHRGCIDRYLRTNRNCPICRQEFLQT